MYLSNRDIKWAIECGHLIVDPPPESYSSGYDETSIDLHLGPIAEAKIWDVVRFAKTQSVSGHRPELVLGEFEYAKFATEYLCDPPNAVTGKSAGEPQKVVRH